MDISDSDYEKKKDAEVASYFSRSIFAKRIFVF